MDTDTLASPARRAFFRRLAKPAQEASEVKLPESAHPRPPWARDNAAFLALCDRCNECIDHCPERVLRPSDDTDPTLQGLPTLTLDHGTCTFCDQCVDHCPTDALSKTEGKQYQAHATVNDYCQKKYQPHCNFCVDACALEAISVTNKHKIVIDTELCTGCGECALDCYNSAITMVKR